MWLELDGTPVGIDGQIDQTLLVVDTSQVAVDDGVVGAQTEGSQVPGDGSDKETPPKIRTTDLRIQLDIILL